MLLTVGEAVDLVWCHDGVSGMTGSRKKGTNRDAPVKNKTKTVATHAKRANPPAPLWALLPSAKQLKQIVAGAAVSGVQSGTTGGKRAASLDFPRALLNSLETLPRPLSLDDVKERLRATGATRMTQTK
jgi:hypothetical protein